MPKVCTECKELVAEWNAHCSGCGYKLVLEPEEETRAKYLRRPSVGALLWTQGWTFGARLYLWFVLSLIPIIGFIPLVIGLLYGRRLSWDHGGWNTWEDFTRRMKLMDAIAAGWIAVLVGAWLWARYT